MIKILKKKLNKNYEIFGLIVLIFITVLFTNFFNYKKKLNNEIYDSFINNVYFKKTLEQIVDNLEPKYKKIKHKIKSGETFDKILEYYSVNKKEIIKIKNSLQKKANINNLNTKQSIEFSLDKTTDKIKEFTYKFQILKKYF